MSGSHFSSFANGKSTADAQPLRFYLAAGALHSLAIGVTVMLAT